MRALCANFVLDIFVRTKILLIFIVFVSCLDFCFSFRLNNENFKNLHQFCYLIIAVDKKLLAAEYLFLIFSTGTNTDKDTHTHMTV